MSWWDIIKQPQTLDVGLPKPKIQEEQLQITNPQPSNIKQPTLDVGIQPQSGSTMQRARQIQTPQERLNQKTKLSEIEQSRPNPNLAEGVTEPKYQNMMFNTKQPQQQQQTNTPAADSGDAGSDVGETVGRIKQHLARNPQGAKGIKTLPIIEKLILASQNPTAYQQEVKDAVKQLKQLVPTAV